MQTVLSVEHLRKAFGPVEVVKDVTFDVRPGEIFGLLGPNGAGKTTTIRVILDLFKADGGSVAVLGGPMNDAKKARIGYLPEERGLYKDMKLEACLVYLAELKGVRPAVARERARRWFERFDLAAHKDKKINDLSKGMQQKAQLIATLLHQPDLLIIDEPFSGLDPVNTRLAQEVIQEERQRGAALIMSTHQMRQVEELCDRIVLIHAGRSVLFGPVDQIRREHADNAIRITSTGNLPTIPGVIEVSRQADQRTLHLPDGLTPQDILRQYAAAPGVQIEAFERALPTMDDIFVKVTGATVGVARAAD